MGFALKLENALLKIRTILRSGARRVRCKVPVVEEEEDPAGTRNLNLLLFFKETS